MGTKAIMTALLVDTDEQKQSLYDGFKELGFHPPKILHVFRTLPGQGGEGGRSDVLVEFHDDDIPQLACHWLHLSGGFSWHDDYVANNRSIIPVKALEKILEE